MIWTVRIQNQEELTFGVTDVFLNKLRPRVKDATVKQLDPYRDSTLDRSVLVRWRDELDRVKQEIRKEVEARLMRERDLPREAVMRETIMQDWVDRELAGDEHFQTLLEVEASVGLALDGNGVIDVLGD